MQIKATVRWLFAMLLLMGYGVSNGQPGFRFPVGESAFAGAYATALSMTNNQTVSQPITSETGCVAMISSVADDQSHYSGPPTLGGGTGQYHNTVQSNATLAEVKGNRARIEAYGVGGTSASTLAMVNNYRYDEFLGEMCMFALQVSNAGGGHGEEFLLPFIMPEPGPVALVLYWAHQVVGSWMATGECGGLFAEPSFGYRFDSGFNFSILDSSGNPVFAESFSTNDPALRHIARDLFLPAGRYLLIGTNGSTGNTSAVAVVNPWPSRCVACTVSGGAAAGASLTVTLVAYRRTIPIPLEAVRADVDGNYRVDDGDMLMVLAEYGNDGRESLADINLDGAVDDADLLMVLQWFGSEY